MTAALIQGTSDGCLKDVIGRSGLISDGDWVESKDQDPDGDVRLVQLADIGVGMYLDKSSRFLTSDKAKALRCTFLRQGDLLVARMPDPIGRACIFPGDQKPCVTVVDVCVVRPDPAVADSRWLMHAINSSIFSMSIDKFVKGTTRQRISRTNLEEIPLRIPPLPEQHRIAAILDKAEALRTKRRAALSKLDDLAQCIFIEMFGDPVSNPKGWPVRGIESVCNCIVDCVNRTAPTVEEATPFKMIRTSNVKEGRINLSDVRYVTEDVFHVWNRRLVPSRGDVLLTREAPVGESAVIDFADTVFLGQRLMLYRTNPAVMTPAFLHALFQSQFLAQQFDRLGSGSTVKHLPLPACRGFQVLVPPVKLQQKYSRAIASVEGLRDLNRQAVEGSGSLFSAMCHRAFRGEL